MTNDAVALALGAFLSLATAAMAQEMIVQTDFNQTDHPAATGNPRVTGQLPTGWSDNSEWAQVWVDYTPGEREGRRYLNIQVTRLADGRAQTRHSIPKIDQDSYFRLELVARSPSGQTVQVGIRQDGAPYEFLWSQDATLGSGWQTLTYDFRLPAHPQDVGLYLNQSGPGELHLASARLVRFTKDQFLAAMEARFPGGSPPNLMRTSTFPLGLQSGWNLWRELSDGDEVKMTSVPSERVPGGGALRMEATNNWVVYSAPIEIARPIDKHTASLYAKGEGTLRLTVFIDGTEVAAQGAELKPDAWTRVQTSFEPVLLAKATVLRIEGGRQTTIDAVQVSAGPAAADFALRSSAEVSLATDSVTRILFDDEKPVINFAVAGNPAAGTLRARLYDAYGREMDVPASAISKTDARTGTIRIDGFSDRPLGAVRLEAWLEDAAGKPASPANELVVLRIRKPRYWGQDAPDSPFGVHTLSANRHSLLAKSIGANWVRLHDAGTAYIGWRYLEPEKGKWTFKDAELARYRQNHLKILGAFATSPNWASYYPGKEHNGYFDQFYLPKNWDDYTNYVRRTAEHHKGVIDTYDIWNEPWIRAWWAVGYDTTKAATNWDQAGYVTSEHPQADFAHMTKLAADAARGVDPSIQILGVNSTTSTGFDNSLTGKEWTEGIAKLDGEAPADVYCYHQYSGQANLYPGDEVERGFEWAMGPLIAKHGKLPKPVWMTEGSATRTKLGSGLYRITSPANGENVRQSSDALVRFVVSLMANGVQKSFVYSLHSHNFFGQGGDWRVLITEEGYAHPSAAAYSAMAWLLEDSTFVERIPAGEGVNAYLFAAPGRTVAVIAPVPGSPGSFVIPAGIEAQDLFGNPLKPGETVTGEVAYLVSAGDVAAVRQLITPGR